MTKRTMIGGYAALIASAGGFLVCRAILAPPDWGPDVVLSRTVTLVTLVASLAIAILGARWILRRGYLVVAFAIIVTLPAAPTLLGVTLDLSDFLAGNGYNGFGATLMIMVGRNTLIAATAFVLLVALTRGIQEAISQQRSREGGSRDRSPGTTDPVSSQGR